MRVMRRSLFLASLALSAAITSPALAGARCDLNVLATLDTKPDRFDRPMVTAVINDKPVALLMDTGASLSSLTPRVVRELNLQTKSSAIEIRGISGARENLETRLPFIILGRLRLEGPRFMVLPGDPDSGPSIDTFGGLLGVEMLRNVDFDFDFAANKINLVSQDHCAGSVVYWQAAGLPVAIVPFTFSATGHVTFRMELDGRRVNAMLDTGATTTILNLDVARRNFRVDVNASDVEKVGEIGAGSAGVYRRRFNTIAFEGVTINNPIITMYPDLVGGQNLGTAPTGSQIRGDRPGLPDLILGMNTLRETHLYVSSRERRLYITAASPQPAAAPEAK